MPDWRTNNTDFSLTFTKTRGEVFVSRDHLLVLITACPLHNLSVGVVNSDCGVQIKDAYIYECDRSTILPQSLDKINSI